MKKTWIIPHEAVESFGRMFLDGFVVLKLHLHRLPAKAAEVSGSHFLVKNLFVMKERWKEKIYSSTQDI